MPLGEEKQNAEAHIIGSHPDGKAVCDHRRRVGGSLRQDGPRCAENDPITRTTERDPEECGAACTCVRRCGSNYWRPEHPRRQVRTGLTPQGPAARDALYLCPSRSVSTKTAGLKQLVRVVRCDHVASPAFASREVFRFFEGEEECKTKANFDGRHA